MYQRLAVFDTEGVILNGYYLISALRRKGVFPFFQFVLYALLYKLRLIDYSRTVRTVYWLLRGVSKDTLLRAFDDRPMMNNVAEAIQTLHEKGFLVALVSSGIPDFLMKRFACSLHADLGIGLQLHFMDDIFTGRLSGPLTYNDGKARVVRLLARKHGFTKKQIITISNDRNNIPMFKLASINVAFNPDIDLRRCAKFVVDGKDLRLILPILIPNYVLEPTPIKLRNELNRKLIHSLGVLILPMWLFFGPEFIIPMIQAITMIYMVSEILRMDGYYLPIISEFTLKRARNDEQNWFIASPVYYAFGLLATLSLFSAPASFLGVFALTIGDSVATLVGIRFGRHKLFYNRNKSWEGTTGAFLSLFVSFLLPLGLLRSAIISAIAVLIETLPLHLDDNLTMPLATAWFAQYILLMPFFG